MRYVKVCTVYKLDTSNHYMETFAGRIGYVNRYLTIDEDFFFFLTYISICLIHNLLNV